MGNVIADMSMSLDGFAAGPNDGPDQPLGEGGELGGGIRLFDQMGPQPIELGCMRVVDAPGVTHLRFRVMKSAT